MGSHAALIAEDFAQRHANDFSPDKLAEIVATLKGATNSVPASGGIWSAIFYIGVGITVHNGPVTGPHFSGSAGGLSVPGGGTLNGDVYSDDFSRMNRETISFEFNAAAVYTSLLFFNGDSTLLGHFEAASTSTVIGVGGGTGSWTLF